MLWAPPRIVVKARGRGPMCPERVLACLGTIRTGFLTILRGLGAVLRSFGRIPEHF